MTDVRIKMKSHLYIWEDLDQQIYFNFSINKIVNTKEYISSTVPYQQ